MGHADLAEGHGANFFFEIEAALEIEHQVGEFGAELVLDLVFDEQGREVERYTLPNGARLHVTDGQSVSNGQLLAEWDPFNEPFVSEVDGFIKFTDLVDGKTYQEKLDEATHQASMTIIEYRTTSFRPSVSVCDENGDPKLRGAG